MSMRTSLWMCHHPHHRLLTLSKTLGPQIRQLSERLTRFLLAPAEVAWLHSIFPQRIVPQAAARNHPDFVCFPLMHRPPCAIRSARQRHDGWTMYRTVNHKLSPPCSIWRN